MTFCEALWCARHSFITQKGFSSLGTGQVPSLPVSTLFQFAGYSGWINRCDGFLKIKFSLSLKAQAAFGFEFLFPSLDLPSSRWELNCVGSSSAVISPWKSGYVSGDCKRGVLVKGSQWGLRVYYPVLRDILAGSICSKIKAWLFYIGKGRILLSMGSCWFAHSHVK